MTNSVKAWLMDDDLEASNLDWRLHWRHVIFDVKNCVNSWLRLWLGLVNKDGLRHRHTHRIHVWYIYLHFLNVWHIQAQFTIHGSYEISTHPKVLA